MASWRPTADRSNLELRAALLAHARNFFADRGVLEVDTPIVVNAPVTDVHIHSARVQFADNPRPFFLHTSPEYAMKRLLAAGSGDIYQICHVVRGLERGRQHNAEFTLIEWYRIGYSLERLMDEVELLVRHLLGDVAFDLAGEHVSYREAFLRDLRIDPFSASDEELTEAAKRVGFVQEGASRDELLELMMGIHVGPRLGQQGFTFVHNYPASQAALARINPDNPQTALRFELYCRGMELANGFEELSSAEEQRARFEHDNAQRQRLGLPTYPIDEHLLSALPALPRCAGVALGFDRTLMLAADVRHIDEILPFPTERA